MVFMGHGFSSGGQELEPVFSAAVGKIQASERYVDSLLLVLKDFSQGERFALQLPLDHMLALWK